MTRILCALRPYKASTKGEKEEYRESHRNGSPLGQYIVGNGLSRFPV
jgi:hypothetical protein